MIALIGCGRWGQNLARNLHSLGVLSAISDPNPVTLEGARKLYPEVETFDRLEAVLDRPDIRACVVAAPAAQHYQIARQVLETDRDVLVEKPLALNVRDGLELERIAESRGRILMVGHILEYHPAIVKLRELIHAKQLGEIRYIYSTRLNLGRIRTEENALWSFAPHDIQTLLTFAGELPLEVACHGGNYLDAAVADVTMSMMRFSSGLQAHIFVSWLHPYKEHRLVVVGSERMAVFDDSLEADKLQLYGHTVDWVEGLPVAVKGDSEAVEIRNEEPLLAECRHFLECIESRRLPRTSGENGVQVLRVLERLQDSMELGGAPLPVEDPEAATITPAFSAHPTATIDAGCRIGENTKIWHYTHVMEGAEIGSDCVLGQNVFVGGAVRIGNNVKIQNNVSIYDGVLIEDDVFCGPSMVFTNVINPRSHVSRKNEFRQTLVRRGASIGANATVVCGNSVGRYAFVGAGAVVSTDVPDFALVVGVPARVVGWMCACGARLPMKGVTEGRETVDCGECGSSYRRDSESVTSEFTSEVAVR